MTTDARNVKPKREEMNVRRWRWLSWSTRDTDDDILYGDHCAGANSVRRRVRTEHPSRAASQSPRDVPFNTNTYNQSPMSSTLLLCLYAPRREG